MTGYVADLSWKSGARAIEKLDRLRSTLAVNVLTMHGHMNLKFIYAMLKISDMSQEKYMRESPPLIFPTFILPQPPFTTSPYTKPPFGSPSLIMFFLFVTGLDLLPILFYIFTLHVQSDKEERSCNWRPNKLNKKNKK